MYEALINDRIISVYHISIVYIVGNSAVFCLHYKSLNQNLVWYSSKYRPVTDVNPVTSGRTDMAGTGNQSDNKILYRIVIFVR